MCVHSRLLAEHCYCEKPHPYWHTHSIINININGFLCPFIYVKFGRGYGYLINTLFIYIYVYFSFLHLLYIRNSEQHFPLSPLCSKIPPYPPLIFYGFKWPYMARYVLRLLFYRGGAQRVTAGRFCVNLRYHGGAVKISAGRLRFWRV